MITTTPFCKVSPNHIGILRFLGNIFLLCGFFSLISGKTYFKRTILRDEEPGAFWIAVVAYIFLGFFFLLGTYICPTVA